MQSDEQSNIKKLVGETLVGVVLNYIDTDEKGDVIMLTTKSGRKFKIYHEQDCCEVVKIQDTEGNWHDLLGKVIVDASEETECDVCESEEIYCEESWTKTTLTFKVNDATVISRWIGTSNGYYSERVDIAELATPAN